VVHSFSWIRYGIFVGSGVFMSSEWVGESYDCDDSGTIGGGGGLTKVAG
jgi:hypothetical protein